MLHCTIWERVQEEGGCTARLSHAIKACRMAFSFILTNVHVRSAWLCSNRLTFWAEDLGIEATGESERSGQRAGMGSQLRMAEPARPKRTHVSCTQDACNLSRPRPPSYARPKCRGLLSGSLRSVWQAAQIGPMSRCQMLTLSDTFP